MTGKPASDSRPVLEFIDLHCHLLPGVDDGPAGLDETVRLLRAAHAGGTRRLLATPHVFHGMFPSRKASWMRRHFEETRRRLQELEPREPFLAEVELGLGAENYVGEAFLEALQGGGVLSLNGSRYLLVEFSPIFPPPHFLPVLDQIQAAGMVPVLAHVERYRALHSDPGLLEAILRRGCLTQVNASAVTAPRWGGARRRVWQWLRRDLVSLIASDAHGPDRPPDLSRAHRKLSTKFPPEKVEAWFHHNPAWILQSPRQPI